MACNTTEPIKLFHLSIPIVYLLLQVCDPNGHWYLADGASGPNDLLLLTGRALSHVTAGLRLNSQYRTTNNGNR